MPIYAYQCADCGNDFDLKQGFDADTEAPCPMCEGPARRRFVAPTVIYKGSGFYTTDYARKGSSGGSSNGASSPTESKSESKAESKSAEAKSASPASKSDSD